MHGSCARSSGDFCPLPPAVGNFGPHSPVPNTSGAARAKVNATLDDPLHPEEAGIPSKTGEFDCSLRVDNPDFNFMAPLLDLL